ncbi:hypothetical protein BZA05DRAFT_405506, partial [Tricharina praecox]|uniref:uncharacterized protein n=1 Tax=Tricharina praecox TaxID=43433 RepID=UPI00221EC064
DLILRTKAKLLLITDPANVAGDAVPAGVPLVNVADALSRIPSPDYALLAEIKAAAKSNHLAYLIWTSGTTGAPKGVPIEHHSGVASMKALQAGVSHDVEGGVRLLQFASYTFDVFIQDLFYAWGVGGVLIAATQEITFGNIAGLANKTNATHAHLTPAYSAGVPRSSCPTFQVITMIGEKLTQNVADDWAVNMRAYNTYGPAEATVVSTMRQFGGVEDPVKAENVGIPLPTVSCHVLRNGRVTMLGGVGELALGGSHLARGYLDDSEKTNAKFIWDEELQERIYLTGDIVRFLHDGSIEFVGRTDDQVKLGGIRVELSEISAAMFKCHPLADRVETMFINRRDRPNKIIVTFVAASQLAMSDLKPNTAITGDGAVEVALAARAQAQEILPEYMVPGLIMVIPFVPQTPSAKIDRKALSATYESIDLTEWDLKLNPVPKQPVQESRSVVESVVIKQIAVLSGMEIDSINLNASLRSLGIDSIRAIQLAAWMKKRGYTLSVLNIIESRTIKELVACIKVENDGSEKEISSGKLEKFDELWHHSVALKMGDGAEFAVLPCSPLQEGLLGETMKNPSAYWSNNFFTLSRKIDLDRLHRAWCQVAEQTEALRAAFIPTAELSHQDPVSRTFVQIVYKQHPGVEWKKVSNSVDNLRDEAKRHAAEITQRNHERAYNAPLWAVTIFERDEHSVMMWSLHHALHDAASLGFIIGDVQAAYLGYNIVPRSQLTDALRLTITEEEADEKKNEEFWTEELKDFVDPEAIGFPDLTGKKPDPSKGRKVYLETECRISATDIQAFAPHFDPTSLISIVRAAWGCTLAGYLETSNIVIGETLSERIQDATLSNTIAPLISVVPVPIQAHATAREILENQSRLSRDVWKHRHILPTTMRKVLQRPQSGALYPAMFVFHPNSEGASEVISAIWTPMEDIVGLSVEHGLALDVFIEADGQYRLVFSAEESLMGNAQLELLMRQVEAYVKLMAMHADMPVPELVPSFPEELLSIARPVVSEAVRSAYETDPMSWVEYYAEKHPEWLAAEVADSITSEGAQTRAWSYAQLNAQANRIAGFIDSCDIGRNRMVALCLPRTLEAYAPIAGVFKAGCGYLSIDEGLPAERKGLLLEDSNAGILFTTTELIKTFPELPAGVVTINIDDPEFVTMLATYSAVNRSRDTRRDDISYLLYTSGSTGKPKGVQVSRGNLSAFVEAQSDFICREVPATLELGGKGKYLGLASRAFDVHVAEMFLAWRHGLATVTALRSMLLDDIGLALAQLKVTHASFVPSLLDQADLVPADVPTLRFMGVGGEKISQRVLDTWAASKTVSLVNAYGPTEVTICCSSLRVSPDSTVRNIGHLIGNLVGYVFVPGTFIPTKRGQPGELCVSGDLVALGYYQRPEAKGFVDYNGARLYRTGDMVRLLSGDAIEYLGRSDDQAKIRGQRLELGEVSEGIRASAKEELDVATLILQHPELSRPQLACFVARSADRATFSGHAPQFLVKDYQVFALELQAGCRQKLPAYMVPDVVIPINIMPLAPMSGKADAKLLKALFSGIPLSDLLRGSGVRQSAASRELTQAEMEIRDMIAKIIKIEPDHVFHASNIFELGIDSLSAITLSLKMKNIGYNSSVASVLGHPTIEELAALPRNTVARENSAENELLFAREQLRVFDEQLRPRISSIVGVSAAPIAAVRPTLPLQEGIIARSINSESGPIYVNHVILKLGSEVDLEKLRQAWKETIDSNEILRTCFCQPDDAFVQVVLSAGTLEEEWQESSAETVDDALAAFRRRQNDVATEIISQLHQRPPLRLNLSRTRSDSSLLFISMHHSIYDGESFMMLLDEVSRHYQSTAVPERVAFSSFLEHLASQSIEKAKDFWTNSLTDCRSTLLSTETGYRKEEEVFFSEHVMSRPLSALEACASSMRCTLPSLAQLVFGILLAQRVGHNDVIFGSVLSGRTATVDLAEMILAPLVTTIPQRVKLQSGTSTIAELAEDYQKSNALCLEYQHISLRQIQRWAGADKPLFDTLFSFTRKVATPGAGLWEEIESATVADYPFAIEFEADTEENKLVARVGFTPSYGTAAEVKVVLEKFDFLLQEIEHGHATLKLSSLGVSDLNTDIEDRKTDVYDEVSWSSTETTMRELAAEICQLPLAQITKGATFYSLGIDSVTAIRFARRLREMDIAVSSSDVIRFPSIGALSRHVAQVEDEASPSVEAPAINITEALKRSNIEVDYESIEAVYTCTPLQSGMITQTLASDGRLYVHHHCVKLDSSVDLLRLQSSWFNVVEKTDVLRTSFYHSPTSENPWTALVRKTSPAKVIEDDASVSFDQTLADIVNNVVFTEEHDFHNPPAQARIVRTPTDNYFVLSLHHSLYDGVSIPFVFHDLASAYLEGSFPRRRPFSDAAALIAQRKDDAAEYWLRTISDYSVIHLARLTEGESSSAIHQASKTLGPTTAEILAGCKSLGVTLQSVLLLAWGKTLSSLVGRRDIVFGQVVSGRTLPLDGVEGISGPLFNTVPMRIRLPNNLQTNESAVSQIQLAAAESQVHQHASLRTIQNRWRAVSGGTAGVLFDTLLVFQKVEEDDRETSSLWTPVEVETGEVQAEYPLNIEIVQGTQNVVLQAAAQGEFMTNEKLKDVLEELSLTVLDILQNPARFATAFPASLHTLPVVISDSIAVKGDALDARTEFNPDEAAIRKIISEIASFPSENITLRVSIYAYGIDSISAIRVAAACRKQGIKLSVADILQGGSIEGICARFARLQKPPTSEEATVLVSPVEKDRALAILSLSDDAVETVLPVLAGQFFHLEGWLKCGRTSYQPTWTFAAKERLNIDRLQVAWQALLHRHQILRTAFAAVSPEKVLQVILKPSTLAESHGWSFEEVEGEATPAVKKAVYDLAHSPLDMFTPPVRLTVLRGDDFDAVLFNFHHAVYDAWSMPSLISDLISLYSGTGCTSNAAFATFAEFVATTRSKSEEESYWKASLAAAESTVIGPTYNASPCASAEQTLLIVPGVVENYTSLEARCKTAGMALSSLVLTSFSRVLAAMTETRNPTFGIYQVGRSASFDGLETLAGPCLNLLPLTVPADLSARDAAKTIQAELGSRSAFEQTSVRDVLRYHSGPPLEFNVFVNLLWHTEKMREDPAALLKHITVGAPADFCSEGPLNGITALDALDVTGFPRHPVFVDLGPNLETDTIDFGVRCDRVLMNEEEVQAFVARVGEELMAAVEEL